MEVPLASYDGCASTTNINWYSHFRRHPGLSERQVSTYESTRLARALREAVAGRLLVGGDVLRALALVLPAEWDSAHFGLAMARVRLACSDGSSVAEVAELLRRAIGEGEKKGFSHFSLEVDCDDYTSINAAIRCGFEIMDLKRTHCTNRLHPNPVFEKFDTTIRPFTEEDYKGVGDILSQVRFQSRFTRDQWLDPAKSQKLYELWFEQLIEQAGNRASVMVGERGGRVVACHALGEKDLSEFGVDLRLRAGSLYASLPKGAGMYGPILYRSTQRALVSHGLVEATISLNLPVTARVLEGLRPNYSVTAYCFRLYVPR